VVKQLREKLKLNAAALQVPIGLSGEHTGVVDARHSNRPPKPVLPCAVADLDSIDCACPLQVDLVEDKAIFFHGDKGENIEVTAVPESMAEEVQHHPRRPPRPVRGCLI